jgi:hypothetical protein
MCLGSLLDGSDLSRQTALDVLNVNDWFKVSRVHASSMLASVAPLTQTGRRRCVVARMVELQPVGDRADD